MVGGWKRVFYKILWRKQSIAVCVLLVTMVLLNRVFYHLFTEYRCTHEILDKNASPEISAKNKTGKYAVIVVNFRREEGVGSQRRCQPCGVVSALLLSSSEWSSIRNNYVRRDTITENTTTASNAVPVSYATSSGFWLIEERT